MDRDYLREVGFSQDAAETIYEGSGCNECGSTGFLGRLGIYELMLMSDDIRRLTISNADSAQLRKAAIQNGMVTLREDGFHKVRGGLTSVSEVLRVTQDS
jgi:type II secretory ATPase GspE/PulE/Tfp pilus assembly ATPase PilB-like protein